MTGRDLLGVVLVACRYAHNALLVYAAVGRGMDLLCSLAAVVWAALLGAFCYLIKPILLNYLKFN
jgi:uncharacterized membrane protein YvlD (DUF360 family)